MSSDEGVTGDSWGTDAVSVWYGKVLALDRVTFRAAAGQVSAVVGGDGAGRTTLLRCLAGALAASDGEIRRPAAQRIGYLPPARAPTRTSPWRENLAFRAAVYGVSTAGTRRRIPRAGRARRRPGPARRAAVRRNAPEAGRHRRDAAPARPARAGRADDRCGPGEPGRVVVADRRAPPPTARLSCWPRAISMKQNVPRTYSPWTLAGSWPPGHPQQIVASMPGTVRVMDARPAGRRGAAGLAAQRPLAGLGSGRRRPPGGWRAGPARPAGRGDGRGPGPGTGDERRDTGA